MNILDKKPQLVPKHQKGSGEKGIQIKYNGPQYYEIVEQMKKEDPDTYNRLQIETARKQNPNSEIVMYIDSDGNIRHATNIGAGFVSGTDPIGAELVTGIALGKPLELVGKTALLGLGRAGNNQARAKLISREMKNVSTPNHTYPLNIGWGPKQIVKVTHVTDSQEPLQLFFDKRYDKTSINIVKENAHKLSNQEWDQIYEAALEEGNTEKLKELRALHFQVKSGNDPQVFAHSTNNTFNQFDKSFFGQTDEGFNGRGFYFTTTRVPENQLIYKIAKGPNGEIPYMNYGRNKKYFYLKGNREYNVGDPNRNFFEEVNTVGFVSPKDSKVSEVIVGQPTQIKNARAITYDDNGNFIPLSKRDDFTNPDFRYKKGAKILIKKKR